MCLALETLDKDYTNSYITIISPHGLLCIMLLLYMQVKDSLTHPMHNIAESVATIVCFLVQEGASIDIQNNKGQTPLQLCTPAMAAVITTLAERSVRQD